MKKEIGNGRILKVEFSKMFNTKQILFYNLQILIINNILKERNILFLIITEKFLFLFIKFAKLNSIQFVLS